ncbi:MAG: tRNA lysidine(34) synthetase TilS [Eubacteriales bacterium]|nr:tRNA lysidine(34) synthetase TilS [Eubacteriales bacterium]
MENYPDILARLARALSANDVGAGTHVLAAVSGGADSVALLCLLQNLKECGKIGIVSAAHFHHGIRGSEADADEAFVRELCKTLRVPYYAGHGDVPNMAKETGETLEEAARNARYSFLRQVKESCGATYIVTAHTMNDQAETVLMHILRGSGTAGLCAMKQNAGDILRPMLDIQRAEIEAYLMEKGQDYRTDSSNASMAYTRNRVRHELLPLLQERFNPSIIPALHRLSEHAAEDEALLNEMAAQALRKAEAGENRYDRNMLLELPPPIQIRALRLALSKVNALFDMEETGFLRLAALLDGKTGGKLALPNGQWAYTSYALICFGALPKKPEPFCVRLQMQGVTETPHGTFIAETVSVRGICADNKVAYLDADRLPKDTVVRSREAGDSIQPLGMRGTKALKDYFIDKKLPQWQRDVPLICSGQQVIFVPGCGISEKYRVRADTKTILRIAYQET